MVAEVGESVVFIMSVGVKAIMPHPPLSVFLLGRAQPVIPPNLYFTNIKAWGPQVICLHAGQVRKLVRGSVEAVDGF